MIDTNDSSGQSLSVLAYTNHLLVLQPNCGVTAVMQYINTDGEL